MDPNANLREQCEIAAMIIRLSDHSSNVDATMVLNAAERLTELVIALDEWISRGGFVPTQWANPSNGKRFPGESKGSR